MSIPAATIVRVDGLDCAFEPRDWDFAREQAAAIDAHWAQACVAKPGLFNGRILLMHHHAIAGMPDGTRQFGGGFMEVDYKAFLAWRDFGAPGVPLHNCFAMAALQAPDGAFLLGEMGTHTANAGLVHFAAGTPDRSDIAGDKVDLAGSVLRELREETGLTQDDITLDPGWIVVFDGPRIACMKRCVLKAGAQAVLARIHRHLASEAEPELLRMHLYRARGDIDAARLPRFMQAYLAAFEPGGL